jgi:FixJ family two-component response regulator
VNGHAIEVHRASVMTKMQASSLSHLVRMLLLAAP